MQKHHERLKEKGQGIRYSKSKFVPTIPKQTDINGNRVLPKKKAEAIAEYLSEVQWKHEHTTNAKQHPSMIIDEDLNIDIGQITGEEIIVIIKKVKNQQSTRT